MKKRKKQSIRKTNIEQFEYDPLKGYEIPDHPYNVEIAEEFEEIQEDEQLDIDHEKPFNEFGEAETIHFD